MIHRIENDRKKHLVVVVLEGIDVLHRRLWKFFDVIESIFVPVMLLSL